MIWTGALITLISSLLVAIVTAQWTVRLALRRFYSEKWWERKSAAYTAIFESMHHIREHADTHLVFETKAELKMPAEGEERLKNNLMQAMADLRKHRDIGSFVISDEAMGVVNALFEELDKSVEIGKQRTFVEYLDYRVGAVDRSLAGMREAATRDLHYQSAK